MSSRKFRVVLSCVLLAVASASQAGIITVRQDGSGDFTNITGAVAAAVAHDSIEVGPGTYDEGGMVEISIPLVLYSRNGPEVTILDGGSVHRILNLRGADIQVIGFSLVDGAGSGICAVTCGGAAIVWQGAHVVIEDCVFENSVGAKGGALYVTDSNQGLGASVTVRKSRFTNGTSVTAGSAAYIVLGASATFESCVFDKNTTGVSAAIDVYYSHADIRGCLFTSNVSNDVAGAAVYFRSSGAIEGNTFVDNTSLGTLAGTILLQESPAAIFRRNIVVGETNGYGLRYLDVENPDHGCNVFWHNAAGAVGGGELAADEVVADPIFCDAAGGTFTISDNSPAAPGESPCGELIGAFPVGCQVPLPGCPEILTVLDIPNDNGGKVRIRWQRSQYDARGQVPVITEYGMYRRQLGVSSTRLDLGKPRAPGVELDGWDFVAVVPARGDDVYQYVAPTLCDAPAVGDTCWSVFFVSAMTSDPLTYFDSDPDSGFSVDNIPPSAPTGFAVQYAPGNGNSLVWDAPVDDDFRCFRLYRGTDPDFTPGIGSLVQETTECQWVDTQHGWDVHYKITTMDQAANESAPTRPGTIIETPGGVVPVRFALYPAVPSPFNPRTTIAYDVPAGGGRVQLRIFEATGRLVRTLLDRHETEGRHQAVWDGTDSDGRRMASGTYFYSLKAPGFERTLKTTLLQ